MYYMVRIDKKSWTKDKDVSISDLESMGFTVQNSRLVGDKDVFFKGTLVGKLFKYKANASFFAFSR